MTDLVRLLRHAQLISDKSNGVDEYERKIRLEKMAKFVSLTKNKIVKAETI
jgi:hypothetical protein